MQTNWLGKSEGATIRFITVRENGSDLKNIEVFTKRPDTLHGVQYLALSVDHPIVMHLATKLPDLRCFIESVPDFPADSKAGFLLPNIYALNPLGEIEASPDFTRDHVPVYVAPYVLGAYGEGAVMGVPGHDARDMAFWKEHHGQEQIRKVVVPIKPQKDTGSCNGNQIMDQPGILNSLCGDFRGLRSHDASIRIVKTIRDTTGLAWSSEQWKLRDWLISRQRFWGTPIPLIHCKECGTLPVPIDQLPVKLPSFEKSLAQGKKGRPLEDIEIWVNIKCHKCGGAAKRETDTMDTFMDSSWYFMRYIDPHNDGSPFSLEAAEKYLPVDIYIGGVEHAILHLLYARFISKVFATSGYWPSGKGEQAEPFRKLISQGMVHGKTFSDPETGRFLKMEEVDLSDPSNPKILKCGRAPDISWEKMSKSKYNGVDPCDIVHRYGADVTRAHVLFQAPVSEVLEWKEEKIVGIQRWFGRIWRFTRETQERLPPSCLLDPERTQILNQASSLEFYISSHPVSKLEHYILKQLRHSIISVTESLSRTYSLNTVISDLMELTNTLLSTRLEAPIIAYHTLSALLRMLAPVAPAFAEECWEMLHTAPPSRPNLRAPASIFTFPFPTPLAELPTPGGSELQTCVVQENGRRRLAVEIGLPPKELLDGGREAALKDWVVWEIRSTEEGGAWLRGKATATEEWKRIVVARGGTVVNFVR